MGWEPIKGGGQRHFVNECDGCPCFGHDNGCAPTCSVSFIEPRPGAKPPKNCPLRAGPVTVELEAEA